MDENTTLISIVADADGAAEARFDAFARLVTRYQGMAYGLACALLGDFHLAEDAAQEAFLTAFREIGSLAEPRAFPGWLRRIVVSSCHRLTRKKRVRAGGLDDALDVASPDPGPADRASRREETARVLQALAGLSEPLRVATTLFYIEGHSQREVAEFLEVPVSTVKKRLSVSRQKLQKRMVAMIDDTFRTHPLSDDFAEVVVRRAATEEDLSAAAALLPYFARTRPDHFRSPEAAAQAGLYVAGEEGSVDGAGYFDETPFSIDGTPVRTVRPGELGGEGAGVPDPGFVASARALIALARDRGVHLAVAHASVFDHAFLGFVPSFSYPLVTLPTKAAKDIVTRAVLRPASDAEAADAEAAYRRDPHAPKISAYVGLGDGEWQVIREDGALTGYARVDPGFDPAAHCGMPLGYVSEITVRTREAALAVIRLAAKLAADRGEDSLLLMQSHRTLVTRTMIALGGEYRLRGPCPLPGLDSEMALVIDLEGLARDLAPAFRRRHRSAGGLAERAALSIGMGGETVGFVSLDGEVEVVPDRQAAHLDLPRWVVTRLFLGYHGGADVLSMGPLPWDRSDGRTPDDASRDGRPAELPEPEAALFGALFPRLCPTALPDPDVWPWLIGDPYPRYQDSRAKSASVKGEIDALRFPWVGY